MNINKIITFSIIAGILSFTTSCSSNKEDNKNKTEIKQAIPVKSIVLQKETINRTINYTATLIPFKEVYLAPATPGKIEKIYVKIGDFVKKGQILAVMNRTNLEQAKLNLMNLETNYKRSDTLKKTNTISDQQYDQVKTAYEAAKVSYQFLLDNTQLRAPFSGVISGKYFENNEIFSGAPNTKVGKSAIVKIVKINKLKALIGISESYFPQINVLY
ncbi:MAG: efflux RND transporter periplasmic adaptor subunit [Chlorobi bacterium]|nr:efflux RND transporter periplasmic adaptor subunit [Chlorobiota bacterium]